MRQHVGHVAAQQVGCGGGHAAGQIRGADDGHAVVGDLGADGGAFDVAAKVACRAIDDDGATMQTGHTGLGQKDRRLASRHFGGGDDDVEAGGLLIDRGLLLGLLFGAQRACVAAFALALGEVKTKVEELGAQGFDFALGCRTHVVRGDDGAETLGGADGLQAGDTGAQNKHLGRADGASGGGHHRQEGTVRVGCHDGGLVAHHGVLRRHFVHGLRGAQLTRQLFHGDADQTGLLDRGDVIGIGERSQHANDPCALLDAGEQLIAWTIHKTQRVGACDHIVGGDDLRARLRIIFINVVRCDARTGLNQTCNT